jgi:uncharacterized membrane protein
MLQRAELVMRSLLHRARQSQSTTSASALSASTLSPSAVTTASRHQLLLLGMVLDAMVLFTHVYVLSNVDHWLVLAPASARPRSA